MTILKLIHLEGTKSGRTDSVDFAPLPNQLLSLGRDPNCILAFDPYKDPRVSAHHADIVWDQETFWLEDRGSTNGTRINGLKIFERTKLHNGDEIELGRKGARFRIEFNDPEASANDPGPDLARRAADRNGSGGERPSGDEVAALADDMANGDGAGDGPDLPDEPGGNGDGKAQGQDRIDRRDKRRVAAAEPVAAAAPAAAGMPGPGGVGELKIGKGSGGQGSRIDVGDGHHVGQKTMRLILQNAHEIAKKDGGGSLSFMKEVVRQTATESTLSVKLWLFGLSFFFLLTIIALIVIIVLLMNQVNKQQEELNQRSADVAQLKESSRNAPSQQDINELRDRLAQIDRYAVLARPEEFQRRLEELSTQVRAELHTIQDNFDRFAAENQDVSRRFQQVEREFKRSIWLIVSQVTLVDDDGNEFKCQSSGTGFLVSADGHMVTNKHVVQPWKFGTIAAQMGARNLRKQPGSEEILAWPTGAEVLRPGGRLRADTAWSLRQRTLVLFETTSDRWEPRDFPEFGRQRVHATDDNSDLAILRLSGGPWTPVPVWRAGADADGWSPTKLDNVMAVGFPQGVSLFDKTIADTSPSLGTIRKAEDTIHITAPIVKGNSGGPIFAFNHRGEPVVVAVATRVVSDTETIGICIRIEHALALLER